MHMPKRDIKTLFTDYLHERKLRVTPERLEVLETVMQTPGHFDVDQLFYRMKTQGSTVSRATVYNTVDKLREAGVLAQYRFGERSARYEIAHNVQPHHHLICRSCGNIEEFIDKRVDRMARDAAAFLGHELQDAVLHIYGICPACLRKRSLAGAS